MLVDILIGLIMLTNFTLVTANRINKAIQVAVLQGVILGLLPLAMGLWRIPHIVLMAAASGTVEGVTRGTTSPCRGSPVRSG